MSIAPTSPATAGITHHTAEVNGTELHYVSAGTTGSPVLLVHGFPESWWAFRRLHPAPRRAPPRLRRRPAGVRRFPGQRG